MFNFTSYSLYYTTELKYRLFYILLNLFNFVVFFSFYYKLFVLYFLLPIEELSIDFSSPLVNTFY